MPNRRNRHPRGFAASLPPPASTSTGRSSARPPTPPEPDLVKAALDKAGVEEGAMLGDTPWDVKAAKGAGVETVALLTGGFSEQELREAGAVAVFESVADLRSKLDETPLA